MSYGVRFHNAVSDMRKSLKNGESHIIECLQTYENYSTISLDKYPLAILGIIRVVWEHLEFYLNYFANLGEENDDEELLFKAVAELEALSGELEIIKEGE